MASVEAVVVNWRRPENVAKVLARLREQTIRPVVTVVDAAPDGIYCLPNEILRLADRRYALYQNLGSWNRYVTLGGYDQAFTLFLDDDYLPSRDTVEKLLATAKKTPEFGVMGPWGRTVSQDGRYAPDGCIFPRPELQEVDVVVRGYFLRTDALPMVLRARHLLSTQRQPAMNDDDITACAGLKMFAGRKTFVVPFKMIDKELPEPFALWHQSDHQQNRSQTCRAFVGLGWRPVGLGVAKNVLAGSKS